MTADVDALPSLLTEALFRPFSVGSLSTANRIVMAPMGRHVVENGVPSASYAAYFRRRVQGGAGLLMTEVSAIDHPSAQRNLSYARMHGADSIAVYRDIVAAVHKAGGRIIPQLVHCGAMPATGPQASVRPPPIGPSGICLATDGVPGDPVEHATPATQGDIDSVIDGFGRSAEIAEQIGFDGVEIHGAHGYLIDQFFWSKTNQRTDRYGGELIARTRFATEIISEVRRRVRPDFPIFFRWSQWKQQDYTATLCTTPKALEMFLEPLALAGVDVFDCSTRRVWEPEFAGSELNLAGWTKKLTGKPTVTVGSVTLDSDPLSEGPGKLAIPAPIRAGEMPPSVRRILQMLERGECDLVAIGRAHITNADWAEKMRRGAWQELRPYTRDALATLD